MSAERRLEIEKRAAEGLRAALAAIIDIEEDAETVRDTIEGETGLHEAIAGVMDAIDEDEVFSAGIKAKVEELVKRKARIENRIKRKKVAIEAAMQAGELKRLEIPIATLSLRKVPPALEIIDEDLVPNAFWKLKDPVLDRKSLTSALRNGEAVPGAVLGNGSVSLSVRRG